MILKPVVGISKYEIGSSSECVSEVAVKGRFNIRSSNSNSSPGEVSGYRSELPGSEESGRGAKQQEASSLSSKERKWEESGVF